MYDGVIFPAWLDEINVDRLASDAKIEPTLLSTPATRGRATISGKGQVIENALAASPLTRSVYPQD